MAQHATQQASDGYLDAHRECDIVMKGGITSGVVYPSGIAQIARRYRFRQVGGTSAGAIAAGGAAAAELGRGSDRGGFGRLSSLAERLAGPANGRDGDSLLKGLFQPQPATQPTFDVVAAALFTKGGRVRKVLAVVGAALRHHPAAAVLGSLPGLGLVVLNGAAADGMVRAVGVVVGGAIASVGAGLVTGRAVARQAGRTITDNGYGLCSGGIGVGEGPALAAFLEAEFDALAGRTPEDPPLTFGDLETAGIKLRMLGTNLTKGAPLVLPEDLTSYYYDPGRFAELFGSRVVQHMLDHARVPKTDQTRLRWESRLPMRRMPELGDIPIVVAVRMSLSFPILLSAVPLWTVDHGDKAQPFSVNWISDGGIASNFPVHFFDAALPQTPTFAISLAPTETASPEESDNVFLPSANGSGILRRWSHISGIGGFLHAIADTVQNWADNEQSRLPGVPRPHRHRLPHRSGGWPEPEHATRSHHRDE